MQYIVSIRNNTKTCIKKYVNLLYYKQRSLPHISATFLWPSSARCSLKDIKQNVKTIYKYKILIKVCVLSYVLLCCVYGVTIQAEVALLCRPVSLFVIQ